MSTVVLNVSLFALFNRRRKAFVPLAEALLHFWSISTGDVSRRDQVGAPVQRLASRRGCCAWAGQVGAVAADTTASGVTLFMLLLRAGMFYHPHGQHRDVLSVCFSTGTWVNGNTHRTAQRWSYYNMYSLTKHFLIHYLLFLYQAVVHWK